jgi:tRNA threonylcarbamoyladenosine biosynthesis protein TsaB
MRNPGLPSPLLVIEASSKMGSIAVVIDGEVAAHADVPMGASSVDELFPAVQSVLASCSVLPMGLRGIACGSGPGSFTSLRIAASVAKGLAHGTGAELYAVPSLLLALGAYVMSNPDDGEPPPARRDFIVHSDALRGERFAVVAMVEADGMVHETDEVQRLTLDGLRMLGIVASGTRIAVGSSPEPELEQAIVHPSASAITRIFDWDAYGPVPLESWEPMYGRLAEAQVVWEQKHGRELPPV